jgi:glutaconate CoA-transferase subunit B
MFMEGGIITEEAPPRIPLVASDPCLAPVSVLAGDILDTLGAAVHGGQIDVALLSANNIDQYGNINTTCIGPYLNPKVRMAGSGGACDLGSLSKKVIIILAQGNNRFQEKLDYITTPGYLQGNDSRFEAGLPRDTGPSKVVTDLGLYGFDPITREMVLEGIHAGVTIDDVKRKVLWPLKVSEQIKEIPPPTEEELRILREEVDPQGMYIRNVRFA